MEYFDAKKLEMLNVKSEKLPHLWSKKKNVNHRYPMAASWVILILF